MGLFEPNAKPWAQNGIPEDFCFDQIQDDLDHCMPYLELAMTRVPVMESLGIETLFNGPESFTPDDNFQIGESPELGGFYVAAGFNLQLEFRLLVGLENIFLNGLLEKSHLVIYGM